MLKSVSEQSIGLHFVWVYCPRHDGERGNDRADRVAGKATLTSGLLLGRSEVLRTLRHYLWAQSQGHHPADHMEEKSVERGSARRSFMKGRERAIVNQTNIGTVSMATLGKLLRDGVERIRLFRAHRYHLEPKSLSMELPHISYVADRKL